MNKPTRNFYLVEGTSKIRVTRKELANFANSSIYNIDQIATSLLVKGEHVHCFNDTQSFEVYEHLKPGQSSVEGNSEVSASVKTKSTAKKPAITEANIENNMQYVIF